DYVPMQLASTVLGGGFSSRVNQNLREDKGYTYGASAYLAASRNGGRLQAGADVRNEVTGAALSEFFREFERLVDEPVPAQGLADTKRYVAGGYLPMIRQVDAATVQAMARKYWDPRQQSIVVVGDGGAIAGQLEPFGEFGPPR